MRAVVYRGPNDLRLETVPVPRIGPGELLVRVAVCGVCPTDIKKIQFGTMPPPRIFGHETAGTIVRVGARVRGFRPGERVALHHHVPCGQCHFCRHRAFAQCPQYKRTGVTAGFEPAGGGYAEFVRVMNFVLPGVVKIPNRNTFEEGAMLEPVNTVLKAVKRLNLLRGDVVLVAGQGPIGLMFTRLLALEGVKVIATDLLASRLKLARQFGASHQLKTQNSKLRTEESRPSTLDSLVRRLTHGRGLDAAVLAVPSEAALHEALRLVRGGGQLMLFAHTKRLAPIQNPESRIQNPQSRPSADEVRPFPLDLATVCVDEKDLLGSYSSDFTLQDEVARLVFSRRLDVRDLISHRFPLAETAAAVALAARPTPDSIKIVVRADAD